MIRRLLSSLEFTTSGYAVTLRGRDRSIAVRIARSEQFSENRRFIDRNTDPVWALFASLIRRVDGFADIDSSSGIHAIMAALETPNVKAIALGGLDRTLIERNLKANKELSSIEHLPFEIARRTGIAIPEQPIGKEYGQHSGSSRVLKAQEQHVEPLDSLSYRQLGAEFGLIRIPCSNRVVDILKCIHRSLHDHKPVIWMDQCKTDLKFAVNDLLSFYGYRMLVLQGGKVFAAEEGASFTNEPIMVFVNSGNFNGISSYLRSIAEPKKRNRKDFQQRENGLLVSSTVTFR